MLTPEEINEYYSMTFYLVYEEFLLGDPEYVATYMTKEEAYNSFIDLTVNDDRFFTIVERQV
ncbi:hypothetical protein SEA_WEASELS2_230 [Rhodococcus phage Weasels2]|uniref:Uncharacterized protein n=1 Tax=Rhodococcus phage Weasels2 TaxID=1897437 RepID=A0A1I9SAK2_9CAUD|nr:hypothetical protein FDH04_gp186 [Rhodococcus phage Weasels2]AOZ63808.1 hypothetical protein SEA_WEASELS2_230 [Rhodococcus phage Weasels2]